MSIVKNEKRVGKFTSSKVYLLIGKGRGHYFTVAAQTYIAEKRHERKLGRSLDMGNYSRSSAWGLFLEQYVYQHFVGLSYEISASETKINPNIPYHAGSTDLLVAGKKVSDIKCFEPRKFCEIVECFLLKDLEQFKQKFKAEYWQLVSNALIHDVSRAESIVYMPTEEDLSEIKEMAMDYQGADQWKYRFIYESDNHELAYIPNGSKYNSLNRLEFEVPQEDIDFLTERLKLAEEYLHNFTNR
jgi:hypothetical protein